MQRKKTSLSGELLRFDSSCGHFIVVIPVTCSFLSGVIIKLCVLLVVVWCSSSMLVSINEVNLRRARWVLRWVTVFGFSSRCGTFISVCNQPPGSTQPGRPCGEVGAVSNSQRAMTLCGWGVKAGMIRVSVAGETVWSPCYTRPISEHFRDLALSNAG